VAQLSGRPSLGNGHAVGDVEVLVVPSESLRALLVAHADLGERIVRALILRRVGLIEQASGGPVIVGPRGHGRIHTLQTFLQANGHPHMVLDPEHDQQADLMAHYQPRRKNCRWWCARTAWSRKTRAWSISAAASACPSSIATRCGT
jgi:thioredoxin reductase (NADPH)